MRRKVSSDPRIVPRDLKQRCPDIGGGAADLSMPTRSAGKNPLFIGLMRQEWLGFAQNYKDLSVDECMKYLSV